jgi:hypothetical protein
MSITGILLPAPDNPPAFDNAIRMNIIKHPSNSIPGLLKGFFLKSIYSS